MTLWGVRGQLRAAFITVALLTALVGAISWSVLQTTQSAFDELSARQTPRMLAYSKLAQAANALMSKTPPAVFARDLPSLDQHWEAVIRHEAALGAALRAVAALDGAGAATVEASERAARITANLQILYAAKRRVLAIGDRYANTALQLDVLQQEFRLLLQTVQTDAPIAADLAAASRLLALLAQIDRIDTPAELEVHGARVAQALGDVERAAAGAPEGPVGIFTSRLRFLSEGEAGLLALRAEELRALSLALDRLEAVSAGSLALDTLVSARLNAAQSAVDDARRDVAVWSDRGTATIATSALASIAIALLIGWWFVDRRIARRLTRLDAGMRAIAAGDLDTPVSGDGADEIAAMAEALEVFRVAMVDRATAERHAAEAQARLDDALESVSEGFALADGAGRLLLTNRKFRDFAPFVEQAAREGWPLDRLAAEAIATGRMAAALDAPHLDPADWMRDRGLFAIKLDDEQCLRVSIRKMSGDGRVIVLTDVTEERRNRERAEYLATHDALTGLPNRYKAEEALERAMNGDAAGAVIVMRLTGLSELSDTFGHVAVDHAIGVAASRLQRAAEGEELATRIDREDFALIAPGLNDAGAIAARARTLCAEVMRPTNLHGLEIRMRPAVGASRFPQDGGAPVAILMQAEMAATHARASAALAPRLYDDEIGADTRMRQRVRGSMRRAIHDQLIRPWYQPKLRLADDTISGMEALARWHDAGDGPVPPAVFVPVAESSGLIADLGATILRRACAETANWRALGKDLRVAVNVSAAQLLGQDLIALVRRTLEETSLPADALEIELTESVMLADDEAVVARLRGLRDLGLRLAIDDFGTGYSSLSYLKRLPFTDLKIDQAFVRELRIENAEDVRLVRSIIGIARDFGLDVVAEGVETPQQMAFLANEGCDYAQGYLIAKPMDPEAFQSFLLGAPRVAAQAS